MSRKILITGGAGFVGRHFTSHFLNLGDEVHCVDPLTASGGGLDPRLGWSFENPMDYKGFRFYQEDCRDYFRRVKDSDFSYVLHLAANVGGRTTLENSPLFIADNLSIDSEYWQWATQSKPEKTLCFSSSAVYPVNYQQEHDYKLLKEEHVSFSNEVGLPDGIYGWAKLTNEYLSKVAYEKYGLKSVIYRPFSGYGEDQDDSYPFPAICKRVLQCKQDGRIELWGSGQQQRDFIHISDCVRGVAVTMDQIEDASAVNLSTGSYTSFVDFIKKAAFSAGVDIQEIICRTEKPTGVFARAGDTTKQKALGFTAEVSLDNGIAQALKYYATQI